jgi:hypothetical protein
MNEEDAKEATIDLEKYTDGLASSPFTLGPVDFLILFPSFPALPRSFSGAPNPIDGAAELRKLRPLDADAVLEALRPLPALRALTSVQLQISKNTGWHPWLFLASFISWPAMMAPVFPLDDGRFGTKNLVVGFMAYFAWVAVTFLQTHLPSYKTSLKGFKAYDAPRLVDYSWLAVAGLARYLTLASESSDLLQHQEDDMLCTCPRDSCAGNLGSQVSSLRVLEVVIKGLFFPMSILFMSWTSTVVLASRFWPSIYGPILFVMFGKLR